MSFLFVLVINTGRSAVKHSGLWISRNSRNYRCYKWETCIEAQLACRFILIFLCWVNYFSHYLFRSRDSIKDANSLVQSGSSVSEPRDGWYKKVEQFYSWRRAFQNPLGPLWVSDVTWLWMMTGLFYNCCCHLYCFKTFVDCGMEYFTWLTRKDRELHFIYNSCTIFWQKIGLVSNMKSLSYVQM